jgi:hypothetical protein
MKVKFKSTIENPDYTYGDMNKPDRLDYFGEGELIEFINVHNNVCGIVKTTDNKLVKVYLDELQVIE